MSLTVDRAALDRAVNFAIRAVPRHPQAPVLSGLLLDAKDGDLTVTGYDFDTATEGTIDAAGTLEALVPGAALRHYVGGMRGDQVRLTDTGRAVEITCGSATVALPKLDLSSSPRRPEVPEAMGTVDTETLARAFAAARVCVDPDSPKPGIQGIRLEFTDAHIVVAGLHHERAVERVVEWQGSAAPLMLAPVAAADVLKGWGAETTIAADMYTLALSDAHHLVTLRLLDASDTPDHRLYFDQCKGDCRITVDQEELVDAVKFVAVGDTRTHLTVDVGTDSLILSDEGERGSSRLGIAAKVEGEVVQTGWKAENLLRAASVLAGPALTMQLGPRFRSPGLFTSDDDPACRYVAMPVDLSKKPKR